MEDPQKLPFSSTRDAAEWVEQERRKFHTLYQEKIDEFDQAFQENMDWLKDYYNNITNKQQEPVVTRVLKTPSARRRRGQNPRTQIKGLFENPPIPEESLGSNPKPSGDSSEQPDVRTLAEASKIEVVVPKPRQSVSDQPAIPGNEGPISNPFDDSHESDHSEQEETGKYNTSREESPPKAPAIQFPTLSSMKSKGVEQSNIEEISEYPSEDESFDSLSAQGIITSTPAVNRHPVSDDSDIESLIDSNPTPTAEKRYPTDEESFDFSAVGTKRIKLAEMKDMPESMSEMEESHSAGPVQMEVELEETSVVEPLIQEPAMSDPMTIDKPSGPHKDQYPTSAHSVSPPSKNTSRSDMGSPGPLLKQSNEEDSPNANPVSQEDRLKAIFSTGSEKLKQALQSLRSNSSRSSKSLSLDKKEISMLRDELSSLLESTQFSVKEDEPILPEEAVILAEQILGRESVEEIKNMSFEASRTNLETRSDEQLAVDQAPIQDEEEQQDVPMKLESENVAAFEDVHEPKMLNESPLPEEMEDHEDNLDHPSSPSFQEPTTKPMSAVMKSPFLKNKLLNNVGEFSMIDDGDESFMQIMSDLKKIQESLGDDDDEDVVEVGVEDEQVHDEEPNFDESMSDSPVENLTFKQLQEEQRLKMLEQQEVAPEEEDEVENEDDMEQEELEAIPESTPEPQAQQEAEEEQPKRLLKAKSTKGKPIIKSLAAAAAAARKQQEQEEKRAAKAKEMEAKRKVLKAHEPKPLPQPPKRTLRSKTKETAASTTQSEPKPKVATAAAPEKGKLSVFKKLAQAKSTAVSATTSKKQVVSAAGKPLPKIPTNAGAPKRPTKMAESIIPEREEDDMESDPESATQNYNELDGLDKFLDPLTPEKKLKSVVTTTFESIAVEQNGKIQLPEIPSDESDNEDDKPDVPEWAQSPNLKRALMEQSKINPEAIFGKIPAVNMEELFGRKSSRYKLRQSSVWQGVDKLTHQEEMEYEKRMGWRS